MTKKEPRETIQHYIDQIFLYLQSPLLETKIRQWITTDLRSWSDYNSSNPENPFVREAFTDEGLAQLASGCPQLENLYISGMQNLSVDGVRSLSKFRCLKSLDLTRINSTSTAEIGLNQTLVTLISVVNNNAQTLESLNVSVWKQIDDTFIENLAKKAIALRQLFVLDSNQLTNKGLEALANHCLHLTKLDVSWCRNLSDAGITYLVQKCPTLRLLRLIRCDNVSDACVNQLMETHPQVEFQTFTLGCQQIFMRTQDRPTLN